MKKTPIVAQYIVQTIKDDSRVYKNKAYIPTHMGKIAICFKFFSSCGKQYTELNKKRLKMTK